jgi:hypothetical protein
MKVVELLGEGLAGDAMRARLNKSQSEKPVWLHRLNKDGNESQLADARRYFKTEREAKDFHDAMVKNNPGKHIGHTLYSDTGDETLRLQLVNGKMQHAPAGLTSDDDGALDNFMSWLDDQGSAASIWMKEEQQEKLFSLFKSGHLVKSAGFTHRDNSTPEGEKKRTDSFISSWKAKGWTLFAMEENGDAVDAVFTKEKK